MSDRLKDFIEYHREDFDDQLPSDLWNAIDNGIIQHHSVIKTKNLYKMFKIGFGASALVVGTFLVVNSQKDKKVEIPDKIIVMDSPVAINETNTLNQSETLTLEINKSVKRVVNTNAAIENPVNVKTATFSQTEVTPLTKLVSKDEIPESENKLALKEKVPLYYKNNDSLKDQTYQVIDTLFKGVKRIDVKGNFCEVIVKTHDGNDVTLHGEIGTAAGELLIFGTKAFKKKTYTIRFQKIDSTLKVWMEEVSLKERVLISSKEKKTSVLNFEVPVNTDLQVVNSSGDITAAGIQSKEVKLETHFGDIKTENMSADLNLRSSSGNITVKNIKGKLKMKTEFGDQSLDEITGDIWLNSSSGDIKIKQLKGNANVTSSFGHQKFEFITGDIISVASSGNITIKQLKGKVSTKSSFGRQVYMDIEGDISSRVSSGDIEINGAKGTLDLETSFGNITGKNVRLINSSEFTTSSGNIHVDLLNEMKELRFDLRSSSGNLMVHKGDFQNQSDNKLNIGDGIILVKGVSSFGNQNYK